LVFVYLSDRETFLVVGRKKSFLLPTRFRYPQVAGRYVREKFPRFVFAGQEKRWVYFLPFPHTTTTTTTPLVGFSACQLILVVVIVVNVRDPAACRVL
jgi:hypothetical protein